MSIADIIKAAAEKNGSDFMDAIDSELKDRIADAIDQKRIEVTSSMFDDEDDYEDDDDYEEDDETYEEDEDE